MAVIDFSKPATTDNYSTAFVPGLQGNQLALSMLLDSGNVVITGSITPATKRYNRTGGVLEEWNGSIWNPVPLKATGLQTARNINGVPFDGSASITVADPAALPLAGGTLTGQLGIASGIASWFAMGSSLAASSYGTFKTAGGAALAFVGGGAGAALSGGTANDFVLRGVAGKLLFSGSGNPDAMVDSSGNFGVGTLTVGAANNNGATVEPYAGGVVFNVAHNGGAASGDAFMNFRRNGVVLGAITQVSSTGVAFSGVAATATALATARNINGVSFNGSADISIPATSDGTNELGYKGLPAASVTTGAFAAADRGKCVYATGGVTVPNGVMAATDVVTIDNTTGTAITITAGVATLRRAGTTDVGNRTLAAYGIATVLFEGGTVAKISGAGLS